MADTTFTPGTLIESTWLNDVNDHVYDTTPAKHTADQIVVTPASDITSTNVQAALVELSVYNQAGVGSTTRTVESRLREKVSIKDFGAIGDGSSHPLSDFFASLAAAQVVYPHATSLTQEIDWAATQAAVNHVLGLTSGGAVHIPTGLYLLNTTVTIPISASKSLSFVGEGTMSQFKATAAITMFTVGGGAAVFGANYLFRDFGIVQPPVTPVSGLAFTNVNSVRIQGLDLSNIENGILLNATYNARISGNRIYGCTNGISTFVTGTNGTYIYDNIISQCGVGINMLVGGNNIVIRDNDLEACAVSVGITNYTSVLIQGNYIENNTQAFFFFGGTNNEVDIVQNWFGANAVSTAVQNTHGGSFEGNTVYTSTFTQTTTNLADFIWGHNILLSGGVIPQTFWTPVTFLNGYSDVGGAQQVGSYVKDRSGLVHVRGTIQGPADNVAFQLPVGYRPGAAQFFVGVATNNTIARVLIFPDGNSSAVRGTNGTLDVSTSCFSAVN